MKSKLLTLLICLVSVFVDAQTITIDLEFERYLIAENIDAAPADGEVALTAIQNVLTIDLLNYNVSDFSGLEQFTALQRFSMTSNNASIINQINFSQNKNLTSISISSSDNLVDINVNGADALESLVIFRGNNLSNLDVNNNLNLNYLGVYTNNITSLNLANNNLLKDLVIRDLPLLSNLTFTKDLEGLILENTGLSSLDLTDMTSLGNSSFLSPNFQIENNFNLQSIELSQSQVESINLSSNIALETIILNENRVLNNFALPPYNSPLKIFEFNNSAGYTNTLEIKDRTQLESIKIIEAGTDEIIIDNLASLTYLEIDEHINNLTRLNIKNNPLLASFNFRNNLRLINIEIEDNSNLEVLEGMNSSSFETRLERLSVVGNNLTSLDISRLNSVQTLSVRDNPNLASLDLTSINNGNPNALVTFEGENAGIEALDFSTSPNIEIIRLGYNSALGGVPLRTLNLKNGNNTAITELNTSGNFPTLSCIQVDANIVGTNPTNWVKDAQTEYRETCNAAAPVLVSFILPNENNFEDTGIPTPRLLLEGTVTTATTISLFTSSFAVNNAADPLTDYDLNSGSSLEVQIPAGTYDTFTSLLVPGLNISSDDDYEGDEVVYLEAFSNSTDLVNAADGTPLSQGSLIYSYTILEDDNRIDISGGSTIPENGGNGNFTLSLLDENGNSVNNTSGRDIEVFFSLSGEAMQLDDYNITGATVSNSVIIPNGSNATTVNVISIDDSLYEDGEFIEIQVTNGNGYFLDSNLSDTFFILDNDNRVSLSSNRVGVEGANDVEFTISLSDENGNPAINDVGIDMEFDVVLASGTAPNAAILGADFIDGIKNNTSNTIVFPINESSVSFEIELIDDSDVESQENFLASISKVDQGFGLGLVFLNNQATGLINDNDGNAGNVLVSLLASNELDLEDNANPLPQLVLEGTVTTATTISLFSSPFAVNNLADQLTDYDLNGGSSLEVQIPAGTYDASTSFTVPGLTITGDDDYEGNEVVYLEAFSNSTELVNADDGAPLSAGSLIYSYTILEDDYRIDISAGANAIENGSNGSFTVSLLDDAGNTVNNESGRTIEVFYLDNGDAQQGTDYNLSGGATILNGQSSAEITVNPVDDNLFEDEEFIDLEISDGEGYFYNTTTGGPNSGLSLLDNDNRITLLATNIGLEGTRDAAFTISLGDENGNPAINGISSDIEFVVQLASGEAPNAAVLGSDFIDSIKNDNDMIVSISNGQESVTFEVVVIDDTDTESQENFTATIFDTNQGIGIALNNDQATGLINDNDGTGTDSDNDGIVDNQDNCPTNANPDQADLDNDNIGDECDPDIDGDGVVNTDDIFPEDATETADNDNDGSGDNADTDDDNDGILDVNDSCPLVAGIQAENGCPSETAPIASNAIQLVVLGETCENQNNGSFEVTITDPEYTFTISLNGAIVGTADANNPFEQANLADGRYQVCLTAPELPDFERCFGIVISTFERLVVDVNGIDTTSLKARFNVQGSKIYEVLVDNNSYLFEFDDTSARTLEIPMEKGQNLVSITGESDCQGIFTDTIVIGNISIFPNPVKDVLYFSGFESKGKAQISVYNVSGSLVKSTLKNIESGDSKLLLSDLSKGMYFFRVVSEQETVEFKIIKE